MSTYDAAVVIVGWTIAGAVASVAAPAAAVLYAKDAPKGLHNSLFIVGVLTLIWSLVGYSETWAPALSGNIIGNSNYATIQKGVGWSGYSNVLFELAFPSLAVSIVAASLQHRIKPLWLALISGLVMLGAYAPFTFWMLGPSAWLGMQGFGALDYAGGLTVHALAGFTALFIGVCAGKKEKASETSVAVRAASTAMLIVAAFFMNAGRGNGGIALLNTQMAAFSGVASYAFLQILGLFSGAKLLTGAATLEGAIKGATIGLATVASFAGFVAPMWTVLITFISVFAVFYAERLTANFAASGVDVFCIHGLGGVIGAACAGLWSQTGLYQYPPLYANISVPAASFAGSFFANGGLQLGRQCAAISVCIAVALVAGVIIYKVVEKIANVVFQTSVLSEPADKVELRAGASDYAVRA